MLENFQVIEIKKTVAPKEAPLNVIVEPKRIRFVKAVVEVLGYPAYVRFLFNPETRQFAVQVGKGNEGNTVKFSKAKEEQKTAVLFQNEPMMVYKLRVKSVGVFSTTNLEWILWGFSTTNFRKASVTTIWAQRYSGAVTI